MRELIQYHRPEKMGFGVEEIVGPPFSILTSVANGNPIGDRVWLVGRTGDLSADVYICFCFIVEGVESSANPELLYRYVGSEGFDFNTMPKISNQDWYPALLKMTGNFNLGLTEITNDSVIKGLKQTAKDAGYEI